MLKKSIITVAVSALMGLGALNPAVAVPPTHTPDELPELTPSEQHGTASQRITGYFTRYHFKHMELNNELSEQILDRYLEMIDYNKMFLLQEDVQRAEEYQHLFDDMISSGKLQPAFSLYQAFLDRRFERYTYALSLLDENQPFDFGVADDRYYFDRSEAEWAESTDRLNELWRQRVKYDALNLTLTGKAWPEVVETLGKRYNNALKRLTQTNSEDVFQTVMNAFARSVEAHTSYLSPSNSERFEQNMNLSLEGIGAVLQSEYDYTVIRSLVPGGPADKSGEIAPEDKIVGVAQGDEDDAEFVDVVGWRLDDVVELIKGPKGSTVQLQILKGSQAGAAAPKEISIVRDKVKLEDRAAKAEIKSPEGSDYADRKMGVITIPGFYNNLTNDVITLIKELESQDTEGLIIDLRGNGGGSLQEAISLTGLFIDKGPVVQVAHGGGRKEISGDRDGKVYYDGPVMVLVDRYSASASEIFAAALQDYGRAVIVGENTFGKGTVQQHRGLARRFDFFDEPLGSVQYTIAKFYRIDGGSTQMRGVKPDISLPAFTDPEEFGESSQDNALPWDKLDAAQYDKVANLSEERLAQWQVTVNQRVQANPEFQFVLQDIAEYQREKDKTWVSLVLTEREAEQAEADAQKLTRLNQRLQRVGMEPVESLDKAPEELPEAISEPDPYLQETVVLALDMIDAMKLAMH